MRVMKRAAAILLLLCFALLHAALASTKVPVEVVYRGRKYTMTAADVTEVQQQLQRQSGVAPTQQAVLHKGRVLKANDQLEQAGVKPGDTLNVIPTRVKAPASDATAPATTNASSGSAGSAALAGSAGVNFGALQAEAQQLLSLLPMIKQQLQDDNHVEMLRQQLTADPELLKGIEPMIPPEFRAALHDPKLWKQQIALVRENWDEIVKVAEEQLRQPFNSAATSGQSQQPGSVDSSNSSQEADDEFE